MINLIDDESHLSTDEQSLIFRLLKRAEIRRQIATRKSVQEGQPDRLAALLEEAALELMKLQKRPAHENHIVDVNNMVNDSKATYEKGLSDMREAIASEFDRRSVLDDGGPSPGWYEPGEPAEIARGVVVPLGGNEDPSAQPGVSEAQSGDDPSLELVAWMSPQETCTDCFTWTRTSENTIALYRKKSGSTLSAVQGQMREPVKSILLGVESPWGDDDNVMHLPSLITPRQIESFALAIAQECARLVRSRDDDEEPYDDWTSGYSAAVLSSAKAIAEHFGVE